MGAAVKPGFHSDNVEMLKCLGRDVCYLVEFTSYTEMSVSVPNRSVSLVY